MAAAAATGRIMHSDRDDSAGSALSHYEHAQPPPRSSPHRASPRSRNETSGDQQRDSDSGALASPFRLVNGSPPLRSPSGVGRGDELTATSLPGAVEGGAAASVPAPTAEAARAAGSDGAVVAAAPRGQATSASVVHPRRPDSMDRQLDALLVEIDRPPTPQPHLSTPTHQPALPPRKRTPAPAIAYLPGSSPVAGPSLVLSSETEDEIDAAALEAEADAAVSRVMQFPLPLTAAAAAPSGSRQSPVRATSLIPPSGTPSPPPPRSTTDSPSRKSLLVSTPLRQATVRHSILTLELTSTSAVGIPVAASSAAAPPSVAATGAAAIGPPSASKQGRTVSFAVASPPAEDVPAKAHLTWLSAPSATAPGSPASSKRDGGGGEGADALLKPTQLASHSSASLSSSSTTTGGGPDADPDAGLSSCWGCVRPLRWEVPRRFPSDAEIAAGPSKADRARLAASGSSAPDALAALAYDRALGADFLVDDGDRDRDSDSTLPSAFAVVRSWRNCWLGVMVLGDAVVASYEWVKLPFLSLLHLGDTVLDAVVLGHWGYSAAFASHPHRRDFLVAGGVFILAPTAVTVAHDVWNSWDRGRRKRGASAQGRAQALAQGKRGSHEQEEEGQQAKAAEVAAGAAAAAEVEPEEKPLLGLVLLDILQVRGVYESVLTLLEYARARSAFAQSCARQPPPARRPTSTTMTTESPEMTSTHLTRIILQCGPMAMLQAGALVLQYDARAGGEGAAATAAAAAAAGGGGDVGGGGGIVRPTGPWVGLSLASVLSSLVCVSLTVHRYVCADPSWRRRAGAPGIAAMALGLLIHPLLKVAGLALLLLLAEWWLALGVGLGSALVTGWLLVVADARSPSRRHKVASTAGLARTILLLAPCEYATGGIGASDLVEQTTTPLPAEGRHGHGHGRGHGRSHAPDGSPGRGQAARWAREYWPVVAWHALESVGIAAYYARHGPLWTPSVTAFMAAAVAARLLALAFLLPRLNE